MGNSGLPEPVFSPMEKKKKVRVTFHPMEELLDHCSLILLYQDSETSL